MKGEVLSILFAVTIDPQVSLAGRLADGMTYVLIAVFFIWRGHAQKKPKKILGIDFLIWAYFAAADSGLLGFFKLFGAF